MAASMGRLNLQGVRAMEPRVHECLNDCGLEKRKLKHNYNNCYAHLNGLLDYP